MQDQEKISVMVNLSERVYRTAFQVAEQTKMDIDNLIEDALIRLLGA